MAQFLPNSLFAQSKNDTIIMRNGDRLIGKVKEMQRGLLTIDTKYGDNDFKIEWDEVDEIYTSNYFYLTMTNGKHYYGWISSSDSLVSIISRDSAIINTELDRISHIILFNKNFKNRFAAEIDMGLGLAKSNNLRQFTASTRLGYKSKNWLAGFNGSILNSVQDDADPINRSDANLIFQYIIRNDWYFIPSVSFLTSSEQKLNSRWVIRIGVGNYIVRTNSAYWGILLGFNRNIEDYYDDLADRYSWEGYFGTRLHLFKIGGLKLYLNAVAYPNLSEIGRWRFDGNLNLTYGLPLDFYIKIEFIMNYDNRPVEGAGSMDYVSKIGFGWKWDID